MTDQLIIRLNPYSVAEPAQRAAWECSEIVTFCLQSAANIDLSQQPEIVSNAMNYHFQGPEITAAERLKIYENWMLAKGFQELARGIHESLEQAFIFIELLKLSGTPGTQETFDSKLQGERRPG